MECVITRTSFKFTIAGCQIHLSFGEDDGSEEMHHKVSLQGLTEDMLYQFLENFLDKQQCQIQFMNGDDTLKIISNGKSVEFAPDYSSVQYYSTVIDVDYDVCQEAVVACINMHLDQCETQYPIVERDGNDVFNNIKTNVRYTH